MKNLTKDKTYYHKYLNKQLINQWKNPSQPNYPTGVLSYLKKQKFMPFTEPFKEKEHLICRIRCYQKENLNNIWKNQFQKSMKFKRPIIIQKSFLIFNQITYQSINQ